MSDQDYTLVICYRPEGQPVKRRSIPFRWHPSGSEIFECVRRLRHQFREWHIKIISCDLFQTVLIERISVQEQEDDSE